jgi:glutamate racemase
MASNTPSILFPDYLHHKIIGILPPLKQASRLTKTCNVGIIATRATVKSKELSYYIKKTTSSGITINKIEGSKLIDLVENGKFLTDKKLCVKIIKSTLGKTLIKNNIDVVTLSSTHLPFLLPMLQKEFPQTKFIDPADEIAKKIANMVTASKRNKLKIFSSKNPQTFQKHLKLLGIKIKINFLP